MRRSWNNCNNKFKLESVQPPWEHPAPSSELFTLLESFCAASGLDVSLQTNSRSRETFSSAETPTNSWLRGQRDIDQEICNQAFSGHQHYFNVFTKGCRKKGFCSNCFTRETLQSCASFVHHEIIERNDHNEFTARCAAVVQLAAALILQQHALILSGKSQRLSVFATFENRRVSIHYFCSKAVMHIMIPTNAPLTQKCVFFFWEEEVSRWVGAPITSISTSSHLQTETFKGAPSVSLISLPATIWQRWRSPRHERTSTAHADSQTFPNKTPEPLGWKLWCSTQSLNADKRPGLKPPPLMQRIPANGGWKNTHSTHFPWKAPAVQLQHPHTCINMQVPLNLHSASTHTEADTSEGFMSSCSNRGKKTPFDEGEWKGRECRENKEKVKLWLKSRLLQGNTTNYAEFFR